MTIERPKLLFLTPKQRRSRLPSLGGIGAVGLMLLAGLNPQQGGKVVWSPPHGVVVWASPDSERPVPGWVYAAPIPLVTTVFKVAGDTSFANPGDWNDASNKVEDIGHGGKGSPGTGAARGGPGGGGGAYAVRPNIPILANAEFPVTVQIGAAGASATPTQFNNPSPSTARKVVGAVGADASTTVAGAGGAVGNCTPNTALSGGVGATAGGAGGAEPGVGKSQGAGGGGSGGPNGAGSAGGVVSGSTSGTGGNADGSTVIGPAGVTGNLNGTIGNSGTEFDGTHGCGTGGSGGGTTSGNLGGVGGNYGGGGGGSGGVGAAQNGAAGLIIISYTPAAASIIPQITHQRRMRAA